MKMHPDGQPCVMAEHICPNDPSHVQDAMRAAWNGHDFSGFQGLYCMWFANCFNEPTHMEPHPVLGPVLACDRCVKIGH